MPISHETVIRELADKMISVLVGTGAGVIPLPTGVPGFVLQTSNPKDGPPVALMYLFGEPFIKVVQQFAQQLKEAIETAELADRQSRKAREN